MRTVLLTGSTGFVGKAVTARLRSQGTDLRRAVRTPSGAADEIVVGPIGPDTDWTAALKGCHAVVHLAARVPSGDDREEDFTAVNDHGSRRLAASAEDAGVRTLIFVSSLRAVCDNASLEPIDDATPPRPTSAYGRSKLAAEKHVMLFAERGRTGISLRPPLVYGANGTGNWKLLQKIAATGVPLPFAVARNRRSMISVENLAHAIVHVLANATPARSGAFLVADAESLSLSAIIRHLRRGMGLPARLWPVPAPLLAGLLKAGGLRLQAESLFGDLVVDSSRFRREFSWTEVESARDAVERSGSDFVGRKRR